MNSGRAAADTGKLTFLQNKEINLGLAHHLSAEQIRLYAGTQFNYLQMEQIRLGLEHGLSPEAIAVFAVPGKKQDQMRQERERLEQGLSVDPDLEEEERADRKLTAAGAFILLGSALLAFLMAYSAHCRLEQLLHPLQLTLTRDQVRLKTGDSFLPKDYLGEYDREAELILPEAPDTAQAGTRVLTYTLQSGRRATHRTLVLEIVEPAPVSTAAVADRQAGAAPRMPAPQPESTDLPAPPASAAPPAQIPDTPVSVPAPVQEYHEEIRSEDSWQEVGQGEVEVTHDWEG